MLWLGIFGILYKTQREPIGNGHEVGRDLEPV